MSDKWTKNANCEQPYCHVDQDSTQYSRHIYLWACWHECVAVSNIVKMCHATSCVLHCECVSGLVSPTDKVDKIKYLNDETKYIKKRN